MKCEAIYKHSSEFSVRKMCKALELCESSYYQWQKGEKKRQKRQQEERTLIKNIREVFEKTNRIYDCGGFEKRCQRKESH